MNVNRNALHAREVSFSGNDHGTVCSVPWMQADTAAVLIASCYPAAFLCPAAVSHQTLPAAADAALSRSSVHGHAARPAAQAEVIHGQRLQRREEAVPICKQQILRLVITHHRWQRQEQRNDNPINTLFIAFRRGVSILNTAV